MTLVRLIVVSIALVACTDHKCELIATPGGDLAPAQELRDPQTGVCQPFNYGGGYCDSSCGPCPQYAGPSIAQPDWATCGGACEALDETTCKATSACRAIYTGTSFAACWGTAPSGPIEGGDCTALDAQTCSEHDDCVAIHAGTPAAIGNFQSCAAEGGIQDPGSCVGPITCATPEPMCPAGTLPGRRNGCWTGYCIPTAQCDQLPACDTLDEMGCIDRSDCEPLYHGVNCTCTGASCTCQSWVFDACQMK